MEGNTNRSHINTNHHDIPDLPEDIIHNILLRLPVKSILKSKCVSKFWRSLICSPQFVKTHLNFSSRNADLTNYGILFNIAKFAFTVKQCSISSLMSNHPIVASDVDYLNKRPYINFWVVGSCNGIICITIDDQEIFLWNPSTRKFKLLPHVDVELRKGYITWGFGYSEPEDDYKVVSIFGKHDKSPWHECIVKIYSLKTNLWKRIVDFNCSLGVPSNQTSRFASGKLHFAANTFIMEDGYSLWTILSLDLKTEAYAFVEHPNYEKEGCSGSYLGTLGSCLSIICEYERKRVDVWVMKEYNVKESWTIVISIPYFDNPNSLVEADQVLIMPNGEILLMFMQSLIVYNPKDSLIKYPRITNIQCFTGADIYLESLVPI